MDAGVGAGLMYVIGLNQNILLQKFVDVKPRIAILSGIQQSMWKFLGPLYGLELTNSWLRQSVLGEWSRQLPRSMSASTSGCQKP